MLADDPTFRKLQRAACYAPRMRHGVGRLGIAWLAAAVAGLASVVGACSKNESAAGSASSGNNTTGSGGCGTSSAQAIGSCVEQARYEADLLFISAPRSPGTTHHQAVQDLCATRFEMHGFQVERHAYGTGTNVIGVLPGATDERVIVSAHYDSTPNCPGADDNATGVAGVLETARVMGSIGWQRTLVVACGDEEEDGLIGSRAYAERAALQNETINGVYVYEMLGFKSDEVGSQTLPTGFEVLFAEQAAAIEANDNRGDFIGIIGDVSMQTGVDLLAQYAAAFEIKTFELTLSDAQKNSAALSDLQRSDHAPFWENDFPALHMTDTANFRYAAYHCGSGQDVPENLDHAFATGIIRATVAAASELLGQQ